MPAVTTRREGDRQRMCTIGVETKSKRSGTLIPDLFIDQYMTRLDGSFIRVYLYLLRHYFGSNPDRRDNADFSIEAMADSLGCMEKDAHRALRGLADAGLLTVSLDRDKHVTGIKLVDLFEVPAEAPARNASAPSAVSFAVSSSATAAENAAARTAAGTRKVADAANEAEETDETPDYRTMERAFSVDNDMIARFSDDSEYKDLPGALEGILAGQLTGDWFRLMLFAYDRLHFSADLIYFLFEYCIEIGKRDARYMTRVAIGWAENAISSVDEAKTHVLEFDDISRVVREQFGLRGNFGKVQLDYILRWGREWQLSAALVCEACRRTVQNTAKSDFRYANTILADWYQKGIRSLEDVAAADGEHAAKKSASAGRKSDAGRANRFGDHAQREYSESEYSSLELAMRNRH